MHENSLNLSGELATKARQEAQKRGMHFEELFAVLIAEQLVQGLSGRPKVKLPIPEIVAAYVGSPNQPGLSIKELAEQHRVASETIRRLLMREQVPMTLRGQRRWPA